MTDNPRDRPVLVRLPNGQSIDPALLVCPECHRFELRVRLSTANPREFMATDDSGHTWTFDPTASPWTTWKG